MNTEKSAAMPAEWLLRAYPHEGRRASYVDDHMLGSVPEEMTGFAEFYNREKKRGSWARIKGLLGGEGSS